MSVLTVNHSPHNRYPGYQDKALSTPQPRYIPPRAGNIHPSYHRTVTDKVQPTPTNNQRHSRNASYSSTSSLPPNPYAKSTPTMLAQRQSYVPSTHSRQPSVGTVNSIQMQGASASINTTPRRSTSSRSTATNSPTSYVALMRKQKATVWCDRSQNIDARMAAAQKAAKQRATLEVIGANSSGRPSTVGSGSMVGKIRHGGVPKAGVYVPPNMSGAGVPLRLSANEMLGDDEPDGRSLGESGMMHARTGSGKSSASSAKYRSGYPRATNSPPDGGTPGREGIPEASETPATETTQVDYFENKQPQRQNSEDSFGELKEMSAPSAAQRVMDKNVTADDLRRRGSVDERTMSMGAGVRLFVANPDLDDD